MSIYTKTGDDGMTSLIGGGRVPKNHPRVEAYGNVDELISFIGLIVSNTDDPAVRPGEGKHLKESLVRIQKNLMLVAAHFATPEEGTNKQFKSLDEAEVKFLETEIDAMAAINPAQTAFILPGAPKIAAECHIARTICRRCERTCIALTSKTEQVSENVKAGARYLNRLADYLFTLGRYFCTITNTPEEFWLP
ncbi:MAG: cob(I)yrinic acid a,c-diamide adenosyltransferase [Bacteroidales bacterium]|jgi:cob(I)alamin adenosyltransferase|nr:cob(I)yrinic acid a,c-diamide adenosyltransferase [Bacteroidales bacterium]MCI1733172.1 cob(I)yrinic acid a,c-diamide adenosyltransferase [Bacteroidales bacterium]